MHKKVEKVIRLVCKEYGITIEDIYRRSRKRDYSEARQMAIYWIWELQGMTYVDIGEIFGLTHATVCHSIHRVMSMRHTDRIMKKHYEQLKVVVYG